MLCAISENVRESGGCLSFSDKGGIVAGWTLCALGGELVAQAPHSSSSGSVLGHNLFEVALLFILYLALFGAAFLLDRSLDLVLLEGGAGRFSYAGFPFPGGGGFLPMLDAENEAGEGRDNRADRQQVVHLPKWPSAQPAKKSSGP